MKINQQPDDDDSGSASSSSSSCASTSSGDSDNDEESVTNEQDCTELDEKSTEKEMKAEPTENSSTSDSGDEGGSIDESDVDDKIESTKGRNLKDKRKSNNESNQKDEGKKNMENIEMSSERTFLSEKVTKKSDKKKSDETSKTEESDEGVITQATFQSLGVIPQIVKACDSLKWSNATQIQQQAIPHALAGRDVIGLAETGSGKTGAFAIPILQELLKKPQKLFAICLAPTRELSFQIYEVFQALGQASIGATTVCIVGGVDMTSQAIALARQPHIIVATPGRLVDHLQNTKGFHLRNVKYLILDEADRMLSMDFEEEINQILDVIPTSSEGRRTMMFSATMTSKVHKLQRASLSDPIRVEVSTKFSTPSQLLQYYMFIPAKYKDCYLTYLINEFAGQSILVFGATCNNVQRLALLLRNLSFRAICLHGQMDQNKRLSALNKFKSGQREILICTDVASRGLDIPSVDIVINYDLPGHGKDYIHRVGRTARAGRSGKAIAMVTQYDVEVYQRLEHLLGKRLPNYDLDEETVLILQERVSEAQRLATRELKEQIAAKGKRGKGRKRRHGQEDDEGVEGGVEKIMRSELRKQGFYSSSAGGGRKIGAKGQGRSKGKRGRR